MAMATSGLLPGGDPSPEGVGVLPSGALGRVCADSTQHMEDGNGQLAEPVPRLGTTFDPVGVLGAFSREDRQVSRREREAERSNRGARRFLEVGGQEE